MVVYFLRFTLLYLMFSYSKCWVVCLGHSYPAFVVLGCWAVSFRCTAMLIYTSSLLARHNNGQKKTSTNDSPACKRRPLGDGYLFPGIYKGKEYKAAN